MEIQSRVQVCFWNCRSNCTQMQIQSHVQLRLFCSYTCNRVYFVIADATQVAAFVLQLELFCNWRRNCTTAYFAIADTIARVTAFILQLQMQLYRSLRLIWNCRTVHKHCRCNCVFFLQYFAILHAQLQLRLFCHFIYFVPVCSINAIVYAFTINAVHR